MEALALQHAILFHKFIGWILAIIILINLISLFIFKDFSKIHKIMWFLTPLFFGFLGVAGLSGISVLAMMKFNMTMIVYVMILVNILIIATEIYRIKKLRYTRKNKHFQNKYISISKILYILYFICILFII
ncbi:hypothetical protein CCY99_02695 [Helicobacter sp. 16-1353]|uniref:hypothetical protein n=1 Tax=Helicobacter sp. 16-1353 TaxID=2004996 RepID=UPI000DCCA6F5|nr:hypothetical protein [Helicobacter sp. 16-1353]RAX54688.1 hypothetical protein CCY99_02695 [Helicobacter sp. 16-1353]